MSPRTPIPSVRATTAAMAGMLVPVLALTGCTITLPGGQSFSGSNSLICSGDTTNPQAITARANATPMFELPGGRVRNDHSDEHGATLQYVEPALGDEVHKVTVPVGGKFTIGGVEYTLVASCGVANSGGPLPPGSTTGVAYLLPGPLPSATPGTPVCTGDTQRTGVTVLSQLGWPYEVAGGKLTLERADEDIVILTRSVGEPKRLKLRVGDRFDLGSTSWTLVGSCRIPYPAGQQPTGAVTGEAFLVQT